MKPSLKIKIRNHQGRYRAYYRNMNDRWARLDDYEAPTRGDLERVVRDGFKPVPWAGVRESLYHLEFVGDE